jgi:hypothetical protein
MKGIIMKLEFELDTNDLLYDVLNAGFVAMLKRQLKDSKEYLETSCLHEHDVVVQNQVINSCKILLEYCTGEIYD